MLRFFLCIQTSFLFIEIIILHPCTFIKHSLPSKLHRNQGTFILELTHLLILFSALLSVRTGSSADFGLSLLYCVFTLIFSCYCAVWFDVNLGLSGLYLARYSHGQTHGHTFIIPSRAGLSWKGFEASFAARPLRGTARVAELWC